MLVLATTRYGIHGRRAYTLVHRLPPTFPFIYFEARYKNAEPPAADRSSVDALPLCGATQRGGERLRFRARN